MKFSQVTLFLLGAAVATSAPTPDAEAEAAPPSGYKRNPDRRETTLRVSSASVVPQLGDDSEINANGESFWIGKRTKGRCFRDVEFPCQSQPDIQTSFLGFKFIDKSIGILAGEIVLTGGSSQRAYVDPDTGAFKFEAENEQAPAGSLTQFQQGFGVVSASSLNGKKLFSQVRACRQQGTDAYRVFFDLGQDFGKACTKPFAMGVGSASPVIAYK